MPKTPRELNEYERAVDKVIAHVIKDYSAKLNMQMGFDGGGAYWKITPHNADAAEVYIGGIDEITITVTVDDKYWLEFFINKKKWAEALEIFEKYLYAFFQGKIIGWYEKHIDQDSNRGLKTILEVNIGEKRPAVWTGNILFSKKFKRNPNTVSKQYAAY